MPDEAPQAITADPPPESSVPFGRDAQRGAAQPPEPLNPFYTLLLLAGLLFVITALAYAVIPVLEQRAIDAGEIPPPSAFRTALREDGWRWLLYELAAVMILSLASMWLDRLRTLKSEKASATIPTTNPPDTH